MHPCTRTHLRTHAHAHAHDARTCPPVRMIVSVSCDSVDSVDSVDLGVTVAVAAACRRWVLRPAYGASKLQEIQRCIRIQAGK